MSKFGEVGLVILDASVFYLNYVDHCLYIKKKYVFREREVPTW